MVSLSNHEVVALMVRQAHYGAYDTFIRFITRVGMTLSSTLDFTEAASLAATSGARFIAIDGLPVSGKTTLADQIAPTIGAEILWLDEFVMPEAGWRGKAQQPSPSPISATTTSCRR